MIRPGKPVGHDACESESSQVSEPKLPGTICLFRAAMAHPRCESLQTRRGAPNRPASAIPAAAAHGSTHLQPILVESAWAAVRHQGYLRSLYHRHVMKWGGYRSQIAKKKAIIVVAHALLVIIWHVLATGRPYDELGEDYFTRRLDPERETRRLIAKLEALGHTVSLQPAA
jgi:transposase